jgi:DNA-binding transcriptional regulator LsrR (DeoR family)
VQYVALERNAALIDRRCNLAARAAWLYHAKGQRQEEIARTLNISRPVVQRLIALAASENLIRFQLIHPLADCISLADCLKDRFQLEYAEVVPSVADPVENVASVATAVAFYLEGLFQQTKPVTVGIGGRRVWHEAAIRVAPMRRPMHRLVSLMGNLTREGRAGHYDVILGLAERIGAQCYPLPMPVIANTVEEKTVLQTQIACRASLALVKEANTLMVGIGQMTMDAPLYRDGFITERELRTAQEAGAVGEMIGNCFDAQGQLLDVGYQERLTSFRLPSPPRRRTLIAQCGPERVPAIRAAFAGRLANGLITDEETAQRLLDEAVSVVLAPRSRGEDATAASASGRPKSGGRGAERNVDVA